MSYTGKRITILLMAWGLLLFVGITFRINVTTPPLPSLTPSPQPTPAPGDQAAALRQTLATDPNNLDALVQLAGLDYDQQNWTEAISLYQRALVIDPHNVDVLVHEAAAQLYSLQFADAESTLRQAADLAPDRADIHLLLGLALSRDTPPDDAGARVEWQKVIALAPDTALAQEAQNLLTAATPTGQ